MPKWLTTDAARALAVADDEAKKRRQAVGTPHLLLGLLADDSGRPALALRTMGFSVREVRYAAARKLGPVASKPSRGRPSRSTRVIGIFERAMHEAGGAGRTRVEPHDLLLALVAEPSGKAASILESLRPAGEDDPGMVSAAL